MKKFKKIIAMGCAAVMTVSAMSMSAFAAEDNTPLMVKGQEIETEFALSNFEEPITQINNSGSEVISYITIDGVEVPYEYKLSEETANLSADIMPLAETVYETENNNSIDYANRIYDDNNVYGAISYVGDEDWYVISFNNVGAVNFWLGSIPTGCDYDIYLYEQNGNYAKLVEKSINDGNADELISSYTCLGKTNYFIRIVGNGTHSNAMYLFRARMQ